MSNNNNNNSSKGLGFFGALTIAFIILKLTHFIDWSWWWVLGPIWIPIAVIILLIVIYLCGSSVIATRRHNKFTKRIEELKKKLR